MAMTGGIGYEIDQLAKLGVPELMRRQSIDPQLKYALALQEATKMVEAAARERDMAQQMPMPADVVGQMESSLAKRLAPGVQQQGQRSMQMQNRAAMGLPGQAAPNLARMSQGGIVGYQDGGDVMGPPEPNLYQRMGQGLKNYGANAQESMDILRAAKAGVGVPYEKRSAAIQQVRDEIEAQKQNRDPNFIQRMGQKLMDAGLNVEESKSILKKFYDTFGKTYEEMSNGMAMGGQVKGYASGGEIKAYLASMGKDIADFTEAQIAAIGQMLDSQVARGQNDTLRQVGRGAMGLLKDRLPSGATSEDARQFNREAMQAVSERDIGPSLTDQLNAAQRRISAENDVSMEDIMASPDNNMGIANLINAARTAGGDRVSMQDVMASPDNNVGISNLLGGLRRSLYERTKDYMPDFGAIAGMDMGEFAKGSGLVDMAKAVDESGFFSGLEDALANIKTEVPEDAPPSYRAGVRTTDILSAPFDILAGFIQPTRGDWTTIGDIVEGAEDFGRGVIGMPPSTAAGTSTATATPTPAPLTEAEKFRRDAPAGLVSAIDKAEGERAALRAMFPNAPESTAKQRTEDRARFARATAAPQQSGIASLMQKARPFADKASDIAKLLGRGAGASKGYEFAKIGEESRKIEALNRAFGQEKELKQMDITARDAELARRLTEAAKLAGQEIRLDAYNNAVAQMRMDKAYLDAVKKLEEQYTTGTSDWIPFNERFDEEGFNKALLAYEENYVKNKVLAAERIAGVGQEGTTQTPATQRYQVVQ